jgi:hypothetical protein
VEHHQRIAGAGLQDADGERGVGERESAAGGGDAVLGEQAPLGRLVGEVGGGWRS